MSHEGPRGSDPSNLDRGVSWDCGSLPPSNNLCPPRGCGRKGSRKPSFYQASFFPWADESCQLGVWEEDM